MTTTIKQDDYSLIRVEEDKIGIRGLRAAIEEIARSRGDMTDEEVQQALLEKLSETNHIPISARPDYGKAFVREFRKFLGEAVDDRVGSGLTVAILGPGCYQCNKLEQWVKQVLTELGLGVSVEHVTDLKEIATYGFVRTPALVINGRIVTMGKVPPLKKIKRLVTAAGG